MPKFPSIPRLSVVIPISSDLNAFERTLISVLENRPSGCEVIVANDGSYDDPFDLADEVRFANSDSSRLVDLILAGAAESRGRFVHTLSGGIEATGGWIDGAIEKFEHHDAAAVVPVIRHAKSNRIVAAGWCDTDSRLCHAAYQNRKQVHTKSLKRIGAYLQASLWRREVLLSMADAFAGRDVVEASYAYDHLLRSAGWRCVLATDSELICDRQQLPWEHHSISRGKRLRAIRAHFNHSGGWGSSILAASRAALSNVTRPGRLTEALGQALAPTVALETERSFRSVAVKACSDDATILRMPIPSDTSRIRRAA